ncbi:MAG: hypothetical protein ACRD3W_32040, partial [Terriglobales bacterium]
AEQIPGGLASRFPALANSAESVVGAVSSSAQRGAHALAAEAREARRELTNAAVESAVLEPTDHPSGDLVNDRLQSAVHGAGIELATHRVSRAMPAAESAVARATGIGVNGHAAMSTLANTADHVSHPHPEHLPEQSGSQRFSRVEHVAERTAEHLHTGSTDTDHVLSGNADSNAAHARH